MKRVNRQLTNIKILRVNILHVPLSLTLLHINVSDQAVRRFLKNRKDLVEENIVHSSITKSPHRRFGHLLNFSKEESLPNPLYFQI